MAGVTARAALVVAVWLGVAHGAADGVTPSQHAALQDADQAVAIASTVESLLRRWRLDHPVPPTPPPRTSSRTPSRTSDEELEGIRHYPARRSLHWLPSGLGTHWDLHGESSHPVRHGKHHRGRHHRSTTEAPVQTTAQDAVTAQDSSAATPEQRTPPPTQRPAPQQPNKTLDRFLPLALSSDFATRGAVADVVVDKQPSAAEVAPRPRDLPDDPSIHVRPAPAMDDTCYSSNQVLIIIAMTCMLSLGFIALVMGCVHCCTANVKTKEYETFDAPFLQLDQCDLGLGHGLGAAGNPRGPRHPRAATSRHKPLDAGWSVLRKLHPQATPDTDNGNDSEEELLFHAPSGPVGSPSLGSLHSLHSLQSARERGASLSMEDLLLLGRCR